MEEIIDLFNSIPLPYPYVHVPLPNEQPISPKTTKLQYFVNKVITNLTRDAFKHCGFSVTQDLRKWNASWGRQFNMPDYDQCLSWQKINHFAGAYLMGRKDHLDTRMKELASRAPQLANFYPESYLLPTEQDTLNRLWPTHKLWIVKPSASSRGRGIYLIDSSKSAPPDEPGIVQWYIERPLLITRRKFDIRLYAYIPSVSPLRIYMHSAGLARFCTHAYDPNGSTEDLHMHLTNFSLNKDDTGFVRATSSTPGSVNDSKWTLDFFLQYLQTQKIDTESLMAELTRVTITTVISGMTAIRNNHEKHIKTRHTSHELYGIDIMLDQNMFPHLIEINISPSMSGMDSKLDYDIKFPLMLDLLRMGRIINCDPNLNDPCPGIRILCDQFKQSITPQREREICGGGNAWESPVFADYTLVRDYIEEITIPSGFHLVYPLPETMAFYFPAFDRMKYEDIVFAQWMQLDDKSKLSVLTPNIDQYRDVLKTIPISKPAVQQPQSLSSRLKKQMASKMCM